MSDLMRLDKYLTELNIGTRSQVKSMIGKGRVMVNGKIAKRPEFKVDSAQDAVTLDGKSLSYEQYEYYMLNKPAGCVSATEDNLHKTVIDIITNETNANHSTKKDLFPVGRLDIDTEGLLLITNDGALSHNLLSPKKHVPKTYFARIEGKVTDKDVRIFADGMDIGEKNLTKTAELVIEASDDISEITVTITEGKFHQVKRMFEHVGKKVIYLKRISMGSLMLDESLQPGGFRRLTEEELNGLKGQGK